MEDMNIEEIILKREELNKKLKMALATMERKDTIMKLKNEIISLQSSCPHYSSNPNFQWTYADGKCPFCGFVFDSGREY